MIPCLRHPSQNLTKKTHIQTTYIFFGLETFLFLFSSHFFSPKRTTDRRSTTETLGGLGLGRRGLRQVYVAMQSLRGVVSRFEGPKGWVERLAGHGVEFACGMDRCLICFGFPLLFYCFSFVPKETKKQRVFVARSHAMRAVADV